MSLAAFAGPAGVDFVALNDCIRIPKILGSPGWA